MLSCNPEHITTASCDLVLTLQHEHRASCIVFSMLSCYRGEKAPEIYFEIFTGTDTPLYRSHTYTASQTEEPVWKQWRLPPMFHPDMHCRIHMLIPEGTVLELIRYGAEYETYRKHPEPAIKWDAHLGFWGMAPENTIPAFLLAAQCGFDSCIVNPRRTKDGVFVCLHDGTINRTGRDDQGNPPAQPLRVEDMTYEQLQQWEVGSHKNPIYRNVRVPKLEEFFQICAAHNMKPFFSTGSRRSVEEWQEIREMLQRYNLLSRFQAKCSCAEIEGLHKLFSVFGNDIYGYTLWNLEWQPDMVEKLQGVGFDPQKVHGVIELRENDESQNFTPEIVKKIRDAGFRASALSCWGHKTGAYFRRLLDMGVSEFTEDFHCSMELNW